MKITLTFPLKLIMETIFFFFLIISISKEIAKDDSKYKK
jgi:hypothetical protein